MGGRIDPAEPKVLVNDRARHLQGFEPDPGKSVGAKIEIGTYVTGRLTANGICPEVQRFAPARTNIRIL